MKPDPEFEALESTVAAAIEVLETLAATKTSYVKDLEEVGASTASALNTYYEDLADKNKKLDEATAAVREYLKTH